MANKSISNKVKKTKKGKIVYTINWVISLKKNRVENRVVAYQNETYEVIITYKKMRNVIFRLNDHQISISAPLRLKGDDVLARLETHFPSIQKKLKMAQLPMGEDYIYIFGHRLQKLPIHTKTYLKETLLQYCEQQVSHFRSKMHIPLKYKVSVRLMKTRFGTNSRKTNTLHFALKLVHFAPEIIDSVIYHELAHYYHFNHQPDFYATLLHYCPDYWHLHQKLVKGVYQI